MREREPEWQWRQQRGLRLVVGALRLMGAWPPGAEVGGGSGGGSGCWGRLYAAYVAAATALMASYPACALCVLAGTQADIQVTAVLVGVTSSYVGALFKMFTLCCKRSQVCRLVRLVQHEFPRSPLLAGRAQQSVAASAGDHGARLTLCFVALCCFSVVNWSLGPIALHLLGRGGDRLALCLPWLPGHQPAGAAFHLVYAYQAGTLLLVALWVGALDAFLLVLLVYAAGQLRVLNCTLLQMGARSDDDPDVQSARAASNATAMLRECAKHHLEVCRFVQSVERVAAPALTLQLLVSTFLLCMCAFTATQIPAGSPFLARVVVYMLTGASELLIYCKYCDDVISESERVQQALYGSGWTSQRRAFSSGLLVMLARAQRPLCLRAAHVHPVSLQTFTKVLNASYTVFTLMRQIKD